MKLKIDTLIEKIIEKQNPSVVGIDIREDMIPKILRSKNGDFYFEFSKIIIDSIFEIVPAIKPNIAFFEKFGYEGIKVYQKVCDYAKDKDLIVIGDIKRGDIGTTAESYAKHLNSEIWKEDFITVNPYMGMDTIEPFFEESKESGNGFFVLIKTSNKGSSDFQNIVSNDSGKKVYEIIAEKISMKGKKIIGKYGLSNIGAVVGATHIKEAINLRTIMPDTFFLIPGYGAQGGAADNLKLIGRGKDVPSFIVNSSRNIIGGLSEYDDCNALKNEITSRVLKMKKELSILL